MILKLIPNWLLRELVLLVIQYLKKRLLEKHRRNGQLTIGADFANAFIEIEETRLKTSNNITKTLKT